MEQGGEEWLSIRMGKVTGSVFKTAMAGKSTSGRKTLMYYILGEIESKEPRPNKADSNMKWGTEHEDEARTKYEAVYGVEVTQVGFVELNEFIGVSPDGLIGDDGAIEIKCPLISTHIKYRTEKKMPSDYVDQVQGILWVTGRKWCDFVSYHPASKTPIWKIRVQRDEQKIAEIEVKVNIFIDEIKAIIKTEQDSQF
jgi:putative phage-type endonuclease